MATQEPERQPPPALTSLPRVEDLPEAEHGYDRDRVRDAFDAFRRHALQLQAQLRVLQAAGGPARVEPTAHGIRMDALHLIRSAAEFADELERDAQSAAADQLARTEEEIRRRQHELQAREAEVERYRLESERQRADVLNAARNEARELAANANREATQELREAEARSARLLEQARHQATELTNSARAEVEQTLEWARGQASVTMSRVQQAAEQLLSAAGLAAEDMQRVVAAILRSAEVAGAPSPPPSPAAALSGPSAAAVADTSVEGEPEAGEDAATGEAPETAADADREEDAEDSERSDSEP